MKIFKRNLKLVDKPLLISVVIMLVFGLIMIQSASAIEIYMKYGESIYSSFIKQTIFILLGGGVFLFLINFPTKKFYGLDILLIGGIIFVLFMLQSLAPLINSTKSWFQLGKFTFQPSEFAKIVLIIYFGTYYERKRNSLNKQIVLIFPILLAGVISSLVVIQPDFGTTVIIGLLTIILFYSIPIEQKSRKLLNKVFLTGLFLFLTVVAINGKDVFLKGYQADRFNFLNPCQRYQDNTGYQVCNGFIAFNNGHLLPKGIGKSSQKHLYLPYSSTDFIFPVIVEELGLIVGIIILIMYLIILYRIFLISKHAKNLRGSTMAFGVGVLLLLHISINLIGVLGLGPLTGVPLPFLSYGGSFTLSIIIGLSIVQRVKIETSLNIR